MKRRVCSIFLALAFCLTLLPMTALAVDSVNYIYYEWTADTLVQKSGSREATPVTADDATWGSGDSNTEFWYVAQDSITIGSRVTVTGDVHLILADGCNLTVTGGIQVAEGNRLTIYGQSDGADTMGKLTASITSENTDLYNAAIGGNAGETGGTLTVYGGAVEATVAITNDFLSGSGTSQGSSAYGAAIGGGGTETGNGGTGGTLTVYGGAVEATVAITNNFPSGSGTFQWSSAYGAAIGGGGAEIGNGGSGGDVTIYGGAVEATVSVTNNFPSGYGTSQGSNRYSSGGNCGAVIGGGGTETGNGGTGGDVTIYGGTVDATAISIDCFPEGTDQSQGSSVSYFTCLTNGAGIVNGSVGHLNHQGDATRVQAAAMLMRFCEEYVVW